VANPPVENTLKRAWDFVSPGFFDCGEDYLEGEEPVLSSTVKTCRSFWEGPDSSDGSGEVNSVS